MPQIERLDRVLAVIAEIVEQHIAEPAAEHDPERCPGQKIVEVAPVDQAWRARGDPDAIAPADQQREDVGKRVPANGERADRDRDRIDRRKRDREERHRRCYTGPPLPRQAHPTTNSVAAACTKGSSLGLSSGGGAAAPASRSAARCSPAARNRRNRGSATRPEWLSAHSSATVPPWRCRRRRPARRRFRCPG